MLRKFVVAILVLIFFILQCSVFEAISFAGIVPNLLIILTSSFGFMRGENEGLVIGFFSGLLCDIFFGGYLGFYALIMMYIGYLNGKFCGLFYPEEIKLPIALIVTSDITYGIISYFLLFFLRGRFQFGFYLLNVILPEALYTIVVTLFFYPLVLKINGALELFERKRE